jgi:hypothetical protein
LPVPETSISVNASPSTKLFPFESTSTSIVLPRFAVIASTVALVPLVIPSISNGVSGSVSLSPVNCNATFETIVLTVIATPLSSTNGISAAPDTSKNISLVFAYLRSTYCLLANKLAVVTVLKPGDETDSLGSIAYLVVKSKSVAYGVPGCYYSVLSYSGAVGNYYTHACNISILLCNIVC